MWPDAWDQTDIVFLVSVDGVHCRVDEPQHPRYNKNPKYYSHKFGSSGLGYELCLSVYTQNLVWMNGPFRAGENDISVFRNKGLSDMLPDDKRAIGDRGYRGDPRLSTPSSHDAKELRLFKSRARARHESFNGRIKNFKVMEEKFNKGLEKHKSCFEAICVIIQFQLEHGSPLFDV